ncbi:MAG: hypothetical protein ABFQ65_00100 [Nanoarchaeota archaeon]
MRRKNKLDKYLLLNWKRILVLIALWFVVVILHNFIGAIFGFEEALFFIIAVIIIPIYFIIAGSYSLIWSIFKSFK